MKIQIESDGREKIDIAWGQYLFYRDPDGKDSYYEWEHLTGNEGDLEPVFANAEKILKQVRDFLPGKPLSGLR